jgi:uncharacterized repeat protein (TIGR01451 family)
MAFGVSFCAREKWSEKRMNTTTLVFSIVVLAGLAAMYGATPLLAQSPSYSDFSSISNLVLNPTEPPKPMQVNGNVLRLNSAAIGQVGSAWFANLQPVAGGFSTTFKFQITPPVQVPDGPTPPPFPADGFAFVIQNSAAGTAALGQNGGAIGYGGTIPVNSETPGIDNSLAIEFDTFPNDPWDFVGDVNPANHVALQSCGINANTVDHFATYSLGDSTLPCNLAIATAPVTLADGNPHTVQIEYTPAIPAPPTCEISCSPTPASLQVTIDTFPVFDGAVQVDLTTLLSLASTGGELSPADSAYVGFTGATGAFVENNDLLSWTFTPHESQTISQPAPANVFTTYNFGSYLYKVRPDKNIDHLTVTEVPTDFGTFNAGSSFPTAQCIVYDSTGGKCVEFHAVCQGAACTNVNYDVVTSYDVPSGPAITNPAFLKATSQDCTPAAVFDSNIITAFTQSRTDPTTKGKSKPSFSCFVAVQNVHYSPADVDIANVTNPKVKTGSNLTYVIPVLNFGPASAQGVAITDTIPSGTNFVNAALCTLTSGCSTDPCSLSGGVATCIVGTLDPFTLQAMVLVVNVTATSGTITDTATTTFFNPDPRPADNVATAVTVISNKKGH